MTLIERPPELLPIEESSPPVEEAPLECMIDDEKFLAELTEAEDKIYGIILRITDGRHDIAEDIFQEVCIKAWRARDGFKGDSKITTWLYRIAVNTTLTQVEKRNNSWRDLQGDEEWTTWSAVPGFEENSVSDMAAADICDKVLGGLSGGKRDVMELVAKGYTHDQIAEALGISRTASKVRLYRAREDLRKSGAYADLLQ